MNEFRDHGKIAYILERFRLCHRNILVRSIDFLDKKIHQSFGFLLLRTSCASKFLHWGRLQPIV